MPARHRNDGFASLCDEGWSFRLPQRLLAGPCAAGVGSWHVHILLGKNLRHAPVVHHFVKAFGLFAFFSPKLARLERRGIGMSGDDGSGKDQEAANFDVHAAGRWSFE